MATYKRDNQVFKKEAEDRRKESTSAKNVARTLLGQGLAFGFGDEIEASIKNLFSEKDYNEISITGPAKKVFEGTIAVSYTHLTLPTILLV